MATTKTANVNAVLATIRTVESGSNYGALTHGTGGASGAYQYEPATWQAMLSRSIAAGVVPSSAAQYSYAAQAPKGVQDAVARYDVSTFLQSVGGNVSLVPLHWYYPASISNPALLNYTPPGNSISIGDYQQHWLSQYGQFANLSPAQLAAVSSSSGQTASLTGVKLPGASDIEKGLFGGVIGNLGLDPTGITQNITAGGAIFVNIFNNWKYIAEVIIGGILVLLGSAVILVDTGALKKLPTPIPV